MDLMHAWRVLRKWWKLVALGMLGTAAAAALFSSLQPSVYESRATLVIGPSHKVKDVSDVIDSLNTLDRRSVVATFAQIPTSRTVREKTREELTLTPAQFSSYRARTTILPDTNIVRISVQGPDSALTAAVANMLAEQSSQYVAEWYGIYALQVLDPAVESTERLRPLIVRNLAIGGLLGLLLGIGGAFGMEYIRRPAIPAKRTPIQRVLQAK